MRVEVRKFLFVGPGKFRDRFFKRAQENGIIEFIDTKKKIIHEIPEDLETVHKAHKILLGQQVQTQKELSGRTPFSLAQEITKLKDDIDALYEKRRVLKLEISRIEPFGDFDSDDIEMIQTEGKRVIQFFFTNKADKIKAPQNSEVFHIAQRHNLDYFISLNEKPRSYEGMIEMNVEIPVTKLCEQYEKMCETISQEEKTLDSYAQYRNVIDNALIEKLNQNNLKTSSDYVQYVMDDRVFAVEGWVASSSFKKMKSLLDEMSVHSEEIAIEKKDRVPTYLENKGFARIGQDVINIYDAPSVEDKDPSRWVLWTFAFFFAVIIGDGGYGLIFLALALFLRYKFPKVQPAVKRVMRLFTILACSCIIWGVLTNSFFGLDLGINNPLRKFSLVQYLVEKRADYSIQMQDDTYHEWIKQVPTLSKTKDGFDFLDKAVSGPKHVLLSRFADSIMLEIALMIGVLHITTSFLRNIKRHWAGSGWIIFMVGGYLFFPSMLGATSIIHFVFGVDQVQGAILGKELIYFGIGTAVILALIQKKLSGVTEILTVIQVFSDVLSYLRLYALALAGGMMSATFNSMGQEMGMVVGVIIIVIGHIITISINIMGGVIHGLRLNFLEWYNHCFEGGGKLLKPLALLK